MLKCQLLSSFTVSLKTQNLSLAYQQCLLSFREETVPSFQPSNDVSLDLNLRLGGLYLSKGRFFRSHETWGSVGFTLGADAEDYNPEESIREKLEIGSSLGGRPFFRWAWDLQNLGKDCGFCERFTEEKIWFFLAYQSGWKTPWNHQDQEAQRFNTYDGGLEYHWRQKPRPIFDPWLSLFTGIAHSRTLKAGQEEAITKEHHFHWDIGAGAGFRVNFYNASPFTYYLGLDASLKVLVGQNTELMPFYSFTFGCQIY